MRRFLLWRKQDPTGVSGTGIVAEGCEFGDGTVVVRWRGETATTTMHASMESVRQVHLHGGATRMLFCDTSDDGPRPCTVYPPDGPPYPSVSAPTERLHDGWSEPNGAEDVDGTPLFVGQQVELVRLHGEIGRHGEIIDIYIWGARGLVAGIYGTDCAPCAYEVSEIRALETSTKQTLDRNNGQKPRYGWAPAITIGGDE